MSDEQNEQDINELDLANLTPTIATPSGGLVMVNPGTGAVNKAQYRHAHENMYHLMIDAKLTECAYFVPAPDESYGDGRFAFNVHHVDFPDYPCEIQMPGWELARVRYMDDDEQNPFDFPRLYVDGSSWLWEFAASILPRSWECYWCEGEIKTAIKGIYGIYCSEGCISASEGTPHVR